MAEYICREALIKELEANFSTDWADYASKNNFDKDYIDGVRDEYDDMLRIICQQKTADVQLVISGDNCIVCGRDVRKDNVYYDVNGGTICESCMNTKYKCKNGR